MNSYNPYRDRRRRRRRRRGVSEEDIRAAEAERERKAIEWDEREKKKKELNEQFSAKLKEVSERKEGESEKQYLERAADIINFGGMYAPEVAFDFKELLDGMNALRREEHEVTDEEDEFQYTDELAFVFLDRILQMPEVPISFLKDIKGSDAFTHLDSVIADLHNSESQSISEATLQNVARFAFESENQQLLEMALILVDMYPADVVLAIAKGDLVPIHAQAREVSSYKLIVRHLNEMGKSAGVTFVLDESKGTYRSGDDVMHDIIIRAQAAA